MPDVLDRLVEQIEIVGECWVWTGPLTPKGYAYKVVDGKRYNVHRTIYEAVVGPISTGLVIDHLCRNRACQNPDHLEPVTSRENTLRGNTLALRQVLRTHCDNGHEFTTENTFIRPDKPRARRCRECKNACERRYYYERKASSGG